MRTNAIGFRSRPHFIIERELRFSGQTMGKIYKCVEYGAGECLPQIIKAGTTQVVVDLSDVPDGARGMGAEITLDAGFKTICLQL
jgi:hypothetical protein